MPDLQGSGLEHQVRPEDAEPRFIILRANRRKVVTACRQDALRCADYLGRHGPAVAATVARDTGVARARAMMYADHYGWFERPPGAARGAYALTPKGRVALEEYADELSRL